MTGKQILATLSGATVEGDGWSQSFLAGGSTIHTARGTPSSGRWPAWPPARAAGICSAPCLAATRSPARRCRARRRPGRRADAVKRQALADVSGPGLPDTELLPGFLLPARTGRAAVRRARRGDCAVGRRMHHCQHHAGPQSAPQAPIVTVALITRSRFQGVRFGQNSSTTLDKPVEHCSKAP